MGNREMVYGSGVDGGGEVAGTKVAIYVRARLKGSTKGCVRVVPDTISHGLFGEVRYGVAVGSKGLLAERFRGRGGAGVRYRSRARKRYRFRAIVFDRRRRRRLRSHAARVVDPRAPRTRAEYR